MSSNLEALEMPLPFPTIFLTEKAIKTFWKLDKRSPEASRRLQGILERARNDVFLPFLSGTQPAQFEPKFVEFAWKYNRMRVDAISLLLHVFGPSEFKDRYIVVLTKSIAQLSSARPTDVENAPDIQPYFQRYLKASVIMASVARSLFLFEPDTLKALHESIVKSDFGITALALIYDGVISTSLWRITETFRQTDKNLSEYELIIGALAGPRESWPALRSLNIEGDVDALFPDVGKRKRQGKKQ